ncbi:MAG TPA: Ig-like domain-containing protein, partial [Planctomycetota bacterium]|nr:Ig-like domain-containing protein [Planctomycetota bacterium]
MSRLAIVGECRKRLRLAAFLVLAVLGGCGSKMTDVSTVASPTQSSATAAPQTGVLANGIETSTITVVIRRPNGNPIAGRTVQLTATGSNNRIVQPADTDQNGTTTGTIASTTAETKTITIAVLQGSHVIELAQHPTVEFVGGELNISASLSTATASTAAVIADGVATSTITVTVRDTNGNPVAGQAVQLTSSGSNNTLVQPGITDASGVAAGTIASTTAETKTVTATVNPGPGQVVVAQQPDVLFVGDPNNLSAALSTAVAAPSTNVVANGVATSTITVTVRDSNGNPVAAQSVALASTGSNNTLVQPGITDVNGVATGTIATTTAETKTITATVN